MVDGGAGSADLTHRERRVLFSRLICSLVLWANGQPGWELVLDEGPVKSPRKARAKGTHTLPFDVDDAVHRPGSYHHQSLAQDLVLYVNGEYISDGTDPNWLLIGEKWESMNPVCTWGGRFRQIDSVHFSIFEGK